MLSAVNTTPLDIKTWYNRNVERRHDDLLNDCLEIAEQQKQVQQTKEESVKCDSVEKLGDDDELKICEIKEED
jgi:hypothetical protein